LEATLVVGAAPGGGGVEPARERGAPWPTADAPLSLSARTLAARASSPADAPPSDPATTPRTGADIREAFLSYYESRGHARLPSASLIPDDPTVLLTIAGMLQFKPVFLGQAPRAVARATTAQKCVRTNDVENVGVTARHHTFFEMLGNFSFGDYFKEDAIPMAWELATKVLGIPAERIWVSVFESDDDAARIWTDAVGLPPHRVQRLGAADNFWASGPTGPCGPCSELYFDLTPEKGEDGASLTDDDRFIEFYNLVFMESNRAADGSLTPLASKCIDTGLGLERVARIVQGTASNFETDLIFPIVQAAAVRAGIDYNAASEVDKARLKVIGDHARACAHLAADGVAPSNVGRGYVLRRLLRRTVVKGRLLGVQGPFVGDLVAVAASVTACDGLKAAAPRVAAELAREEARFATTLGAGEKMLAESLAAAAAAGEALSGAAAFELYDTFGFPLDVTRELAADAGVPVDVPGFDAAMEAQRRRSKDAAKVVDVAAAAALGGLAAELGETAFGGYTATSAPATVVALLADGGDRVTVAGPGDVVDVALDATPFYGEGGGQVGDAGTLTWPGGAADVIDTRRVAGGAVFLHRATVARGTLASGAAVNAVVDPGRRAATAAHHTATHLLQAALKAVLGESVSQQGSLVTPDRLRFDFSLPRGVEPAELAAVEALVNSWIVADETLTTAVMPLADAKAAGAVAMFGEKYDAAGVRVVRVPGAGAELCGGTHVATTGRIGGFKIVSEAGVASGVRRVEAVVGPALVEYLNSVDAVVRSLSSSLSAKPDDLPARVAALQDDLKAAQREAAALRGELAVAKAASLADAAVTSPSGARYVVARLDGVDGKALQDAAAGLVAALGDPAAVLLASAGEGGAVMVAAASPGAVAAGVSAGKFVGGIAKLCGGGGGGRPNLAQAGGKDAAALPAALEEAERQLAAALK
jgi:alanyl-tRNA synthetase